MKATQTTFLIEWLFCAVATSGLAAVIESQGTFVPGAEANAAGGIQYQVAFGSGFTSATVSSASGTVTGQFGPMASIQNAPVVTEDRFNFSGSLGETLEVSYDDIELLSGIVELDGELLQFFIEVVSGELKVDGNVTSGVLLQPGGSFTWDLPADAALDQLIMSITGLDVVSVASTESPIGVEDADSISFIVKSGETILDESSSADLGDAEVSVASVSAEYVICYDSTTSASSVSGLQRLRKEINTWSAAERRKGLVLLRNPPPPSGRLTLSTIDLGGSNANDFEVSGLDFPLVLGPGDTAAFTVTFSPQAPGERLASLSFGRPGRPSGFFGFGVQGRGNRPPTGFNDEVIRPIGLEPLKIRLADLLLNDRDIDGDMVEFGGFSTPVSMRGRTIELLNDEWMVYYPGEADEPQDDSFVYRVSDGRGATAPSVVFIREEANGGTAGAIEATIVTAPGQSVTIRVRGIPGRSYQAQFTDQLNPPNTVWNDLGLPVAAAPQNGGFQITDPQPPPGQRIYRIIESGQSQQPGPQPPPPGQPMPPEPPAPSPPPAGQQP